MKGLLTVITLAWLVVGSTFAATPIETNAFIRRDILISQPGGATNNLVHDFAVGSWNTNGAVMIPVVRGDQKLELHLLDPDGTPAPNPVILDIPNGRGPVLIGDLNNDQLNDIAVGAGTNVLFFINSGAADVPTFSQASSPKIGNAFAAQGMALADVDADGKLDVFYSSDSVYVLRNESGAALAFGAPQTITTNHGPIIVTDLNRDSRPDVWIEGAVSDRWPVAAGRRLYRNTSAGGAISFTNQPFSPISVEAFLDVNGDDRPDAITVYAEPLRIPGSIRFPTVQGTAILEISPNTSSTASISFGQPAQIEVDLEWISKTARNSTWLKPPVVAADFNGDGLVDLVRRSSTNRIAIIPNDNALPAQISDWAEPVELAAPISPFAPTIADVNRDGRPDLIVASARSLAIYVNRIVPTPELIVSTAPAVVQVGAPATLTATPRAAEVTAVEFLVNDIVVATADLSNGFQATYTPTKAGLHTITARANAGPSAGLLSRPVGVRALDTNIGNVVAIGTGIASQNTYLIFDSGRAFGVGSNARGQLSHAFFDSRYPGFVEIPLPENAGGWMQISSGLGFSLGLTKSGRVFSWGGNDQGQLGRSTATLTNPIPGEIVFPAAIHKVEAGNNFSVALDTAGELYAWGANYNGQLGKGDIAQRNIPSKVRKPEGVARWANVSAGQGHVLALDEAGRLFAWGWNFWGQTGQPRETNAIISPTLVPLPAGETAWTNVHAGLVASYAQTASGQTYRWGHYLNETGDVSDHTPTLFDWPTGSGGFAQIGAGSPLNAGLANDGNIYVWGGDVLTPIGLGEAMTVTNPTRLPLPPGVNHWTNLSVAARRAAAIADDGRVFIWGGDFANALGTGTLSASVPTPACMPMSGCPSNSPPVVKIVHPMRGDTFRADRMVEFQVAADDFDGVVTMVKIFTRSISALMPNTEVARLRFGETNALVPAPKTAFTTYFPVAYDNSGLASTGATIFFTAPSFTSGVFVNLTNTNSINPLTGWREVLVNFRNNSTFRLGAVSAILSNVPPEITIRNNAFPTPDRTVRLSHNFGLEPGESITFRIEYKLADDFAGAQVRVAFDLASVPGIGPSSGDVQPLTMTIADDGIRVLEFDRAFGGQYVVQFSDTLTNWFDAGGFLEEREGKFLWLDGGPPATAKHPAHNTNRFYRVLRRP